MKYLILIALSASALTGCQSCCNTVDVIDSRVAIALDVHNAYDEGSETLATVLEEHGLTVAEFEDLMAEIAEDPTLSLAYSRGVGAAE